ncbi:MAG: hypothetical protein KDA68_08675, partial [Planctomycetaceae bacterium]|nr:hypothetical protein [Planctomycetaceae bacterium]
MKTTVSKPFSRPRIRLPHPSPRGVHSSGANIPERISLFLQRLFICVAVCAVSPVLRAEDSPLQQMKSPSPELEQFFEKEVRPLLIAKCIGCHGEKDQKGDVRLDSAEALIAEAPGGLIVVPGKPEASRLVDVIGYNDDIQMPPDSKLTDEQIAVLTKWVKSGAPFPAKGGDLSG